MATSQHDNFFEDLGTLNRLARSIFDGKPSPAFAATNALHPTVEPPAPVWTGGHPVPDFNSISRAAKEAVAQGVSCLG